MSLDETLKWFNIESLSPKEITLKTEEVGVKKAHSSFLTTYLFGLLGGMYVALGAVFSINTVAGLAAAGMPYGLVRLLAGFVFCIGLILVIVAGAELFTGNVLLIIAWLNKKVSTLKFLKNLAAVYLGNFTGSMIIVLLVFAAKWQDFSSGLIGQTALNIAVHKMDYTFVQAVALGILCNILVCLGVWLAYSCKTTGDKVLAIIFPITAFAAGGFDHCVANMFYLPYAFLLKYFGGTELLSRLPASIHLEHLDVSTAIFFNQIPVTIGNFLGGAVFVGLFYWMVYGKSSK